MNYIWLFHQWFSLFNINYILNCMRWTDCMTVMTYITDVQLFLKTDVDLSKLSDLIISQPEVSTVIKVCYWYLRNRKHVLCFYHIIDWNTSGRNVLGTWATSDCFSEKTLWRKKGNNSLFNLIIKILSARAIITSTACASSVFLLSYRNVIFNQSVHVLS